jgi:hypothetical protein
MRTSRHESILSKKARIYWLLKAEAWLEDHSCEGILTTASRSLPPVSFPSPDGYTHIPASFYIIRDGYMVVALKSIVRNFFFRVLRFWCASAFGFVRECC